MARELPFFNASRLTLLSDITGPLVVALSRSRWQGAPVWAECTAVSRSCGELEDFEGAVHVAAC
jgi:hypothetical protein